MKIGFKTIWLLCVAFLVIGCTATTPTPRPNNDDDDDGDFRQDDDIDGYDLTESWEFLPFYGAMQFDLHDAETDLPVPDAILQIEDMPFANEDLLADANGRITFAQLENGITYVGDGPPPPTFHFSAPGYTPRQFSVEELAALSGVDPYEDEGLPLVDYEDEFGNVYELPLYAFAIQLTCADGNCTAVTPTPTETATAAPTKIPLPTLAPIQTPLPEVANGAITGPDYSFENVRFTLDTAVMPALYPELSESGDQITFLFAKDGYCVIEGCIKITRVDLEQTWQVELIPDVETAVTNQDENYQFTNRGAALLLQAKLAYPPAPQVQGVRAVTMHGQDLFVAHNGGIKYEFRGLTADGTYFVQVFAPLTLPFLPDSGAPNQPNQPHFAVPMPETLPTDHAELAAIMHDYNAQVAEILEETAVDTFTPNLSLLDAFIASLQIDTDS
ncbi:hypothetical protein [Candidatus Leptofilum sp.]|uniref:hypothetical protein n=1 Tax=Candidatus Leptofilum sp. TaxID=3241576 RepID=UPI003B5A9241